MNFNIGGEFHLNNNFLNKGLKRNKFYKLKNNYTINGISAFSQILLKLIEKKIHIIYVPDLICESLLLPIKKFNLEYKFYRIDNNLNSDIIPKKDTAILIINYFGTINKNLEILNVEMQKKNFHVIEDVSHCFLNKNFLFKRKNDFFLSLRKHGIIGPGGWSSVNYNLKNNLSKSEKIYLEKNYKLRLKKNFFILNKRYIDHENIFMSNFKKINNSINKTVSNSSVNLIYKKNLYKFNLNLLVKKRLNNWRYLNHLIGDKFETIYNKVDKNKIPIGYIIFLKNRDKLRNFLIKKRIFCGIHWLSKTIPSKNKSLFSKKMMTDSLTIPIDHRYNHYDMEYIAENLYKF